MRTLRNVVTLFVMTLLLSAHAANTGLNSGTATASRSADANRIETAAPAPAPAAPVNSWALTTDSAQAAPAVAQPAQITPEEFYRSAWKAAEQNFLWRDRLTDWAKWEHKYDGQLKSFDDAERAINEMLGTLKDGYTYYKDPTVTADRAARAAETNVVSYRVLPLSNIGYIKVRTFGSNNTAAEFEAAVTALNKLKVGAFIIDLRDNGGGYVHQAFKMFSLFVDEGLFTTLKGHYNGSPYTEELFVRKGGLEDIENGTKVTPSDRLPNLVGNKPVIILVNGNSASASEMFSGALRDAVGATLVGTKTFGKGIAQITVNLERGASVQVTFAEYFLPKGDSVHGKGIQPSTAASTIGPTDPQLAAAVRVAKERMKP